MAIIHHQNSYLISRVIIHQFWIACVHFKKEKGTGKIVPCLLAFGTTRHRSPMTGRETRHLALVINSSNTSAIKVKRWETEHLCYFTCRAQSKGHEIHSIPRELFHLFPFSRSGRARIDIYIGCFARKTHVRIWNNVLSSFRGIDFIHSFHPSRKRKIDPI